MNQLCTLHYIFVCRAVFGFYLPMIFSGSSPRSKPDAFLSSLLDFLAPFKSGVAAFDLRFFASFSLAPLPSENDIII